MKKIFFATVLLAAFTFSCSKTEKVIDKQRNEDAKGLQGQYDFTNPNNDYEFFGEYLRNMLLYVNTTQQDSGQEFPSFDEYWTNFTDYMTSNQFDYSLSNQDFSETEREFFDNIVDLIEGSEDFDNYIDLLTELENNINSSNELTNNQKIRLLAFSSLHKFYIYTSLNDILVVGEIPFPRSWEDFFHDCMRQKLGSFNPIEWTAFIAGMPATFAWLSASCTYDATLAYRAWYSTN